MAEACPVHYRFCKPYFLGKSIFDVFVCKPLIPHQCTSLKFVIFLSDVFDESTFASGYINLQTLSEKLYIFPASMELL